MLKNPDLINTLKVLQIDGRDGFYKGKIAQLIEDQMILNGGLIRKSDLESYTVQLYAPIGTKYRDKRVYAMGPPSGGGIVILTALNIHFGKGSLQRNEINMDLSISRISSRLDLFI